MRNAIKTADLGGVSYSGPQRPTAFSPAAMKLTVLRRYPPFHGRAFGGIEAARSAWRDPLQEAERRS
jgi:hypothetical protein